jgi:EAL domain-containing protein (putative c-di-GMP-specific phosphodiesterase class I)
MFRPDHADVGRLDEARRWAVRVRQALDGDRFVVSYQPVARLSDRTCREYEALIRMEDARGALVESALFIEAAEEGGLGLDLDRLVLERVLRRLAETGGSEDPPRISVNLFPSTLLDPGLVTILRETAAATGGDLSRLDVEIPDWAAAQNLAPLEPVVAELGRLGCRVIVDDLGAGFLSVVHLRRLGVGAVKLHRTLVERVTSDPEASALLRSFTQSLKELGIEVVAKCVESPELMPALLDHGIDLAQGYAIGRPADSLQRDPGVPRLAAGS